MIRTSTTEWSIDGEDNDNHPKHPRHPHPPPMTPAQLTPAPSDPCQAALTALRWGGSAEPVVRGVFGGHVGAATASFTSVT
jgi:hypothetical protein